MQLNAQSSSLEQRVADAQNNKSALRQPVSDKIQEYFDIATNEIDQMLKGEKSLSFKRAVYLVENAIKSGLFMKSLSDIESVAYCIYDLLHYYEHKTGLYSGEFVKKYHETGLRYYPNSQLQISKANDL